ncbi:bifunctional 2-methylcitrate synthase/citrate synthase [Cellulomonas fimi]|uniref:bifunctional 2-methylcitrate synthase/citrate synthase n=1 Tax=Cellulomonas fimi TaxID=1708 RepID=UPI00234DC107|nr:bifunctional 2-methylcitrate synthase/citrate synthase [Cellulomonas fimi]MDC7120175.1 bifunctional 2-methylcitrate synthase/citrate synthase [Cellulomonas fimi]
MTEIHKGLAGVVVDTTAISSVDPDSNSLLYRGYPVDQLAERCLFEEVAYLLWHGELPNPDELAAFQGRGRSQRTLPDPVVDAVLALPTTCHPMDVVRTAVSVLGAHHPRAEDPSREANLAKSVQLLAQLPAVVAIDQRRRRGQEPIAARDDLPFAQNIFWMTFGEVPDPVVVKAFEVSLILYAEHSFNASTFTARVIASTLSDLHSAVTGAVGALKGPLHGGANEAVMATFAEIGTASRAASWLDEEMAAKRKVMGFGHRVYKHGDSRVPTMRRWLEQLVDHYDRHDLLDLYIALEDAMTARTGILPNLDYPTGPAYHLMGFDTPTFTPLFAAARVVGWTAHVMEQLESNSLIRPLSRYDGPARRVVPARDATGPA